MLCELTPSIEVLRSFSSDLTSSFVDVTGVTVFVVVIDVLVEEFVVEISSAGIARLSIRDAKKYRATIISASTITSVTTIGPTFLCLQPPVHEQEKGLQLLLGV